MSSEAVKTKFQRFEVGEVLRSAILPHPRNPRMITPKAAKRLKGKMKEIGLIQPVIVNRRTMRLVGGHQRLGQLDALQKYDARTRENDYRLDVSFCELSEQQELEMLVFLNNPSAEGVFDLDLLADLNLEMGVGFEAMGFDQLDVDMMFDGDARFSHLFEDDPEVSETKEKLDAVKAARAEGVEKMQEKNSAEFYFVVVCRDEEELTQIKQRLGVPVHEQMCSGDAVLGVIGE